MQEQSSLKLQKEIYLPMKFNPGLEKFEPNLPVKLPKSSNKKSAKNSNWWMWVLIVIIVVLAVGIYLGFR